MTYSSEVLADSPLGYWRLGDASGTTMVDSSGNGHDGTYVTGVTLGATGLVSGSDTCADFASGSANVAGAAWMSSPSAVTVEALIRPDTVSGGSYNFIAVRDDDNGTGDLWWLVLKATKLTALCRGVEFSGSTTILPNTTYHVAFTYDGATACLYVNGALDGSLSRSALMSTTARPLIVGRWGNAGAPLYFDGKIDELAYYGSAVSSTRILAHYTAATAASPDATVRPPAATATAAAVVPAVSAASSVAPPAAAATAAALAPAVGANGSATVSPPAATATATAIAPSFTQIIPAGTDTSNSLNGRRRRARASVVVTRPAAATPSRAAVKYDKSVPYPPPTLVNGRPT